MSYTRIFVFLSLLLCSWGSSQAQFQVFAGPQITSAKYLILNNKQQTEYKQGFMAGVGLTTLVEGPLYLTPSIYFSQKGYNVTLNKRLNLPDTAARNNSTTVNTISFAPLLQFNLSKEKSHLFVRFGPAFDFAVSGKESFDSTGNKKVNRSMTFNSTAYSPATAFANVHLGYEFKGTFFIFLNYEHGLSNFNNSDEGPMILNRVAGVALGWKFGKK